MFTKKTNNKKSPETNKETNTNSNSSLKSWLTGKVSSLLIFSAVGYALYKFEIIKKITNLFKKDKGKRPAENLETAC